MHSSSHLLHQNIISNLKPRPPTPHIRPSSPSPPNPVPRRNFVFLSSLLLIISPHTSQSLKAETLPPKLTPSPNCPDQYPITEQVFLDVSINGEPIGRIIIGLYGQTVPSGTTKFTSLISGSAGVSYRRKEFVKIMPNYIQHGGLRSYGVDAEMVKKTGSNLALDRLVYEWEDQEERCQGIKNVAKSVSLIVRDPFKPEPKMKLVARKGKLEVDQEEVGNDPNGTEFVISMKDSPELDGSGLVVGRVIEGMDVVEKIGQVKTVQDNNSSPYFRVAKLIGDKRSVVAERGFNRPYSKVTITNCGLMG